VILGTAGHIDHGKTALVRALTGVDTDRLPEEKRRGITIELGFAPLELEGVGTIGIVDVPGHEAFVRTMLAGASGIDLAMLVIAADEGVMPQTQEHLTILDLLGVRAGVVALTKSDLVDDDWLALVTAETRALIAGTTLDGAPIVAVSAHTGAGLDALRAALGRAAAAVPARDTSDLPRLPVDRAFSVKGIGTVVTGTLWSGSIAVDDAVELYAPSQGALQRAPVQARVRSIETHGTAKSTAAPGLRTALALGGVDRDEIPHGSTLVKSGDAWMESNTLRADVALLGSVRPVGARTKLRLHLGTIEIGARIVAADGPVTAGKHVAVRVALDAPIIARAGDRFVLRASSPPATIGGGVITDPAPVARRAKAWSRSGADPVTRLEWIVEESGGVGVAMRMLPVRLGVTHDTLSALVKKTRVVTVIGDRLCSAQLLKQRAGALQAALREHHTAYPDEPGLPIDRARRALGLHAMLFDHLIAGAVANEKLVLHGVYLARPEHTPLNAVEERTRLLAIEAELVEAGATPPDVTALTARFGTDTLRLLRLLAREGRAVEVVSDRFYSPGAVRGQFDRLEASVPAATAVTASQVREILGLSRKYVIPFLEYCDRHGISVRDGDLRTFRWELIRGSGQRAAHGVPRALLDTPNKA
jgi:selenocysteine-specific elongation factor